MNFVKYSASGNDFIICHTFLEKDFSELAQKVCNRFNGIGADGFIVIVPSKTLDYKWLFYNSDGSSAHMCGNGSRACAHYATNFGIANTQHTFETLAGAITCNVNGNIVQTQLTKPFYLDEEFNDFDKTWSLLNTGVPHLVTFIDDLNEFDIELARTMRYKYNANVNFVKVNNDYLQVRTYERGVEDETLACGTGMAACFLRAYHKAFVKNQAFVFPKSGEELTLSYINDQLLFKGEVKKLFTVCDFSY